MALMAFTRSSHFGSAFSLPDASLAVFFLAGTTAYGVRFFSVLLLEAGIIDYVAINHFGVSDFCISPAYACLILAYLVMWLVGDYCKALLRLNFADTLKVFGLIFIAASGAFFISNGSFYLFSGRFGQLSMHEFLHQAGDYYPGYVGSALLYIIISVAIARLWSLSQTQLTVESKAAK